MTDIPSSLPDGSHAELGAASAIPTITAPVHAAVPNSAPQDTYPEILANAIADLFEHSNVVWHTSREMAANQGKANFLRITSNGDILLDVIKPGIRFITGVHVDPNEIDLGAMKSIIQRQGDWAQREGEGFLPPGVTSHSEKLSTGVEFDANGGARPGAIYVFNRTMVLKYPRGQEKGLRLKWIGRHTNPTQDEKKYQVNDELRIEEF